MISWCVKYWKPLNPDIFELGKPDSVAELAVNRIQRHVNAKPYAEIMQTIRFDKRQAGIQQYWEHGV